MLIVPAWESADFLACNRLFGQDQSAVAAQTVLTGIAGSAVGRIWGI